MNKYGLYRLVTSLLFFMLIIVSVEVVQAQQTTVNPSSNPQNTISDAQFDKASLLSPGEDINRKIKENIFIRVEPNKKECYVGEPLLVVYKLCTRLHSNSKVLSLPSFSGCSVVEMTSSEVKDVEEKINGKPYKTYIIRKVQLFPLQEGRLSLGTATVDNEIKFIEQHSGGNIPINKKAVLTNDSMFVNVKPLPIDTLKSGFTGAIGKFFMIGKVNKTIDTANDNNQLEITISGNGNFISVACPTIAWPSNVQAFETKSTELLDKLSFPILGEKKFLIPFICKNEGEVIIPSIVFRYFDVDTKQYTNAEIDSIHIKVAPPVHINADAYLKEESTTEDEVNLIIIVAAIVLVTMLTVFILLWRIKKKRSLRQYEKFIQSKNNFSKESTKQIKEAEEKRVVEAPLPSHDFKKTLARLSDIEDEKTFYKEAITLCTNLITSQSFVDEEEELNKIIALCNEALYSSTDVNIYLIFLRIEKVIGNNL